MSRSQGATPAIKGGGTIVTTRASVLGASDKEPAVGDRRDSRLVDFTVGQSEGHRSFWESPRRGALQAACVKRAGKGGRAVRIRVSDGLAMGRNGRPCTTARFATDHTQRAG